jgi:hypothetical protein
MLVFYDNPADVDPPKIEKRGKIIRRMLTPLESSGRVGKNPEHVAPSRSCPWGRNPEDVDPLFSIYRPGFWFISGQKTINTKLQ